MTENELIIIGNFLNSKGLDIDLKDDFWMEDYLFDEYKVRDIAELLYDFMEYINSKKWVNV